MVIKILGLGCANCKKLEANAKQAAKELGFDAEIIKITEIPEIMSYGVMNMPAIVVDEKVVSAGRVLNVDDIKKILTK